MSYTEHARGDISKTQFMAEMRMGEERARRLSRIQWRRRHLNEEAHDSLLSSTGDLESRFHAGAMNAAQHPGLGVDEEGSAQSLKEDEDEDQSSADDEEVVLFPFYLSC